MVLAKREPTPPIDPEGRAMKIACAIAKAIGQKYADRFTTHVTPYNCEYVNFIHIELRPKDKSRKDGVGVAYSEAFYSDPKTSDEVNAAAKRVHNDIKALWGVK